MSRITPKLAGLLAAMLLVPTPGPAQTAAPSTPPPGWDALIRCAQLDRSSDELSCFREAMRAAGYQPNPQVAQAQKRKAFGLLPLPHRKKEEKAAPGAPPAPSEEEEAEDTIQMTVSEVALMPPMSKLLIITNDGEVWEQLDTEAINPRPHAGDTFMIRRTRFGGYFCRFGKVQSMRCQRTH